MYAARKEPGTYQSDEILEEKKLGGDPATKERAMLRKQCKPEGPYGLLLESVHIQAAALDETMKIIPQDSFIIDIAEAPIQQLAPLTRQLAMKNRTERACGTRWETEKLEEIDFFATEGEHKGKIRSEEDKLTLNIMRTGSTWTRVATFWTGKSDDETCQLCKEEEESADHLWRCRCLKEKAKELDKDLAEIDPGTLTNSMLIGVAPAMDGDTRKTYWGTEPDERWSERTRKMMGCHSKYANETVRHIIERIVPGIPARTVMQSLIAAPDKKTAQGGPKSKQVPLQQGTLHHKGSPWEEKEKEKESGKEKARMDEECLQEQKVEDRVPERPNVYSDGSLKQNKCYFWQTGGAGVFWPGRKMDQLTEDEATYTEREQIIKGLLLWCPFNSLLNSSTRTELAAAIVAIIPAVPVHIGIDNAAVVDKGSQIIKFYDDREKMRRSGEQASFGQAGKWTN